MKKGICANCGREISIAAKGYCGSCYNVSCGRVGEQEREALAAIKAKIESGGLRRRGGGRRKPLAPAGDAPAISTKIKTAPARVAEGTPVISIDFSAEEDREIYDAIIGMAKRNRRDLEQQVLWLLGQSTGLSPYSNYAVER